VRPRAAPRRCQPRRARHHAAAARRPAGTLTPDGIRWSMPPLLAASIGYLAGSIPSAFLVSRARGVDVRRSGSGNVGATNVLRTSGAVTAACVMLLDMAKGAGAVQCVSRLSGSGDAAPAVAAFAAVV